jgi:uncharacterized protein (TIGR02145 family)
MKMKVTGFPLILLSVVLLLNACKKDDDSIEVNTLEVTNIGSYSATLNGEVASNENPVTERGFYWSATNENPGEADSTIIVEGTTESFSAELSRLELNTTYYVRAYAINNIETSHGEQISFTTLDYILLCNALDNCDLSFTTSSNTEWFAQTEDYYYTGSSAQSGIINDSQQSTLETTVTGPGFLSFYWKVSSESGDNKLKFYIGSTMEDDISGTADWTLKEYIIPEGTHTLKWCYAKENSSSSGQDCGWLDKIVFTTGEPTLPTVTTTSVTNISQTMAKTGGEVTSSSDASITARGVCWNTTGNPTIADNKISNGTGTGNWTSELTELQTNTTYYIRAYATNIKGTTYGEQITFTTETWEKDTQTAIVDVTNPKTGFTWMDRNLGASRVATSSTDEEAYGDLYQWGRAADGHEKRDSPATTTLSTSDTPGHGKFIITSHSPSDWRVPQNTNLWQGVNGTNNPCPNGYRLPTNAEWDTECKSWNSSKAAGAFASPLKLPMAGSRNSYAMPGSIYDTEKNSSYWSSTVSGNVSHYRNFSLHDSSNSYKFNRARGYSVRCIKD